MSKTFNTMLRIAAVASITVMVGTTGALASDNAPSAKLDTVLSAIHAKQAEGRANVQALVKKSHGKTISTEQLARIHAKQAEGRANVQALVKKSHGKTISTEQLARIHAKQAEGRANVKNIIKQSRVRGLAPKAYAHTDAFQTIG